MAWSKPFDQDELTFIQASFPRLSSAEIAERIGRSKRGVNEQIRKLGLREAATGTMRAREVPDLEQVFPGDTRSALDDLIELRDVLRHALGDCGYRDLPKMAAEYRATLEAIERMKGTDEQDADGDDLSKLLGVIEVRGS